MLLAVAACSGNDAGGPDGAAEDLGEQDLFREDSAMGDAGEAPPDVGVDGGRPLLRNVLLLIADDLGLDASAQYDVSEDLPETPTLDGLAREGLVFDNAWATPACTTTRGTLITGRHGIHSGVDRVPDTLDDAVPTLHRQLGATTDVRTAVIGKWHLTRDGSDLGAPLRAGADHYAGTFEGVLDSYTDWTLTTEGRQERRTAYHTSAMTDLALDWIAAQEQPWFLWLAFVAPHSPFHLPPAELHERGLSGTAADIADDPRPYYLAAIEAMDREIGRLLATLAPEVRDETLIVFVGDNGSPARAVSEFQRRRAKGSLYEGGVRVPLVVSGAGVTRRGEREAGLVHTVDVAPTLLEILGAPPMDGVDGESFAPALTASGATPRALNYTEFVSAEETGWAVRDARYKLIVRDDGSEELFDVAADLFERTDLAGEAELAARIDALRLAGLTLRGESE
ncbi:MAG: sulfatase-like hydrolase/transferase [Myxococcota bacterium]